MKRSVLIALLIGVSLAAERDAQGPASLSPAEALAGFELEPGYRIELAAAEPLIRDPVAMAFDERGRMFVVENRGYPGPLEGATQPAPEGVIALLEDTDRDGRFDKRTDFADKLSSPNGVMPWGRRSLRHQRPRFPLPQRHDRRRRRGRAAGDPDGIRRRPDRADSIQSPDARARQLDLSDQRLDRRPRDLARASRSSARDVHLERFTLQSLHARRSN